MGANRCKPMPHHFSVRVQSNHLSARPPLSPLINRPRRHRHVKLVMPRQRGFRPGGLDFGDDFVKDGRAREVDAAADKTASACAVKW